MATVSRVRRFLSAFDAAAAASAFSCAISAEVFDVEMRPVQSTFVEPDVVVIPDEMPHFPVLRSSVSRRARGAGRSLYLRICYGSWCHN